MIECKDIDWLALEQQIIRQPGLAPSKHQLAIGIQQIGGILGLIRSQKEPSFIGLFGNRKTHSGASDRTI